MKLFEINLSEVSTDRFLRNDEKFYSFYKKNKWILFPNSKDNISLYNVLQDYSKEFNYIEDEEYFGIPTGRAYVDELGDIIDYQIVTAEEHPKRLKYKIDNDSILISSLRLARAPALNFENIDYDKYVFSNGFYVFKIKNNWNKYFVIDLLKMNQLKNIIDNNIYRGIGISAYKKEDLLNIKVPNISIEKQNEFEESVREQKNKIQELKAKMENMYEIINDIFMARLNNSDNTQVLLNKGMTIGTQSNEIIGINTFEVQLSGLANNRNIRLSTRSSNNTMNQVMSILKKNENQKIKDVYTEIVKGVQPEYSEDGIPVIKIASLKNSFIDLEEPEYARPDFVERLDNNKYVKKNDIIICSIGKGSLGKVDIVKEDLSAIVSVDNYILRVNEELYNPEFLTYYLRSIFGIVQFEQNYSGATNQIHYYDYNIKDIIIPKFSLNEQRKIVELIKEKIEEQLQTKKSILKIQEEIEEKLVNIIKEATF